MTDQEGRSPVVGAASPQTAFSQEPPDERFADVAPPAEPQVDLGATSWQWPPNPAWNPSPPRSGAPGPAPAIAHRSGRIVAPAAIAAVVAAVVGATVGVSTYAAMGNGARAASALVLSTQAGPVSAKVDGSVAGAAAAVQPSVVTISASGGGGAGTGSGVVIRPDGYVLTNDHVVTLDNTVPASAAHLMVTTASGQALPGVVVGTDLTDDLAVIKIGGPSLTAASFASSGRLTVGQTVIAIGAPLGLSDTVTAGIVSALDRPVQAGSSGQAIFDAVQTDAAINPGNSGGPLIDLNGRVVGINSAIASADSTGAGGQSGSIGIGFAIPSDEAARIADQLISTGTATHAVLGISVASATGRSGTTPTSGIGARVSTVQAGSPAANAGIAPGDVITRIGAQQIDDSVGLIAAVRSFSPGQNIPVVVTHNGGSSRTVQITLGGSPSG